MIERHPSPGTVLARCLAERHLKVGDLVALTGLSDRYLGRLVKDAIGLLPEIADHLERVLGVPATYWEAVQVDYLAGLRHRWGQARQALLGRQISSKTLAHRVDLPEPYVKILLDEEDHTPGLDTITKFEKMLGDSEVVWAQREEDARAFAAGFPKPRALFRENWTDEDRAREASYQRTVHAWTERRKTALLVRGWKIVGRRSYEEDGCGFRTWATDPTNGDEMLLDKAYAVQEARDPGLVEPYPTRDFENPPSTQPLYEIGDVKVQPMEIKSSRWAIMERLQAAEDGSLYKSLDELGKKRRRLLRITVLEPT